VLTSLVFALSAANSVGVLCLWFTHGRRCHVEAGHHLAIETLATRQEHVRAVPRSSSSRRERSRSCVASPAGRSVAETCEPTGRYNDYLVRGGLAHSNYWHRDPAVPGKVPLIDLRRVGPLEPHNIATPCRHTSLSRPDAYLYSKLEINV
jgi:hypothetical protein